MHPERAPQFEPKVSKKQRVKEQMSAAIEDARERIDNSLLPDKKKNALKMYDPEFIGSGRDQVVFEIESHPDNVAKVNLTMLELVRERLLNGNPATAEKEAEEMLEKYLAAQREAQAEFRAIFAKKTNGKSSIIVPRSHSFRRSVPVTRNLLKTIGEVRPNTTRILGGGVEEIPTVVCIQERVPEGAFGPESIDFTSRYVERSFRRQDPDRDQTWPAEHFREWSDGLLKEDDAEVAAAYLERMNSQFAWLVENLPLDDSLRSAVAEFVDKAVAYTEKTENIIDVAGASNIRLFRDEEGEWKIIPLDALMPGSAYSKLWKELEIVGERVGSQEKLSRVVEEHAAMTLISCLNYARFINALGILSGTESRLRVPSGITDNSDKVYALTRDLVDRLIGANSGGSLGSESDS